MSIALRIGMILALSVCAQSLAARTHCPTEKRDIPVSHGEYEKLQEFVNSGHEPWRLDARAVAADQVFRLEKTPKKDWDVYALKLSVVEQDDRRAIFQFLSKRQGRAMYHLTVRRFEWLLPLAKKREWIIWVPTEVKITRCQAESNR